MKAWDFHFAWSVIVYVGVPKTSEALGRWNLRDSSLIFIAQADRIDLLEREQGWREEEFDFILQFLRTILTKRKW